MAAVGEVAVVMDMAPPAPPPCIVCRLEPRVVDCNVEELSARVDVGGGITRAGPSFELKTGEEERNEAKG